MALIAEQFCHMSLFCKGSLLRLTPRESLIPHHQMRIQKIKRHKHAMPISSFCQKIMLGSALFFLAACSNQSAASSYLPAAGAWIDEDGIIIIGEENAPEYYDEDAMLDPRVYSWASRIDRAAVLAAHNRWRQSVWAPPLRWSEHLARTAQDWADYLSSSGGCLIQHSNSGYGENIYQAAAVVWSDGRTDVQRKTVDEVVDGWASEIQYYDYASNSCADFCGHYTQLIWRQTRAVGCAVSICPSKKRIWVCHYDPPGNVSGQRPY